MTDMDLMANEECRYFFQHYKMAASTARYYAITLRKLFRFIGEHPAKVSFRNFYENYNERGEFLSISPVDTAFIDEFLKTIPEPYYKRQVLSQLRTFFRVLCSSGGPLEGLPNPAQGIQVKVPERIVVRDVITPDEFSKMIACAGASEHPQLSRAVVTTLYGTGLRVSELINLPLVEDVEHLRALLVPSPKTRKEYLLPLLPQVMESILTYIRGERRLVPARPETESLLFLTPKGRKLSGQWVNKLLKSLCAKAGIQKGITSHCLRHSFATNLWKNGADIAEIKELLNHASITTTQLYVHTLPRRDLRKVIYDNPLAKIVGNFWSRQFMTADNRKKL